ncbi:nuclear speckle splicing regulatory protein 1 [Quillaja saponaria]|uniref:Nuclear speckle splicing regulatory protein 1 n=1 Tax=Quillaja saponaria TaxID=32244 RepID=A0AAD7VMP7_QUISA|nr:nuclear speckle splicing regulatory protein 1 [Quillaja saponaria]KAJ7981219.1 nuclear speckle splicing regulatory protein 1 [Quillaja saponaria]
MSKYGLNLRPVHKKHQSKRPPLATHFGFNDEEENDVEREIARQASKNKSVKEIEEQQKKALEEDPTVFDYDGVYDKMKEKEVRPVVQDREERKPKYIQNLMKKAQERQQYQDIVYEKKLAKERSKDDHLYADKDKFITEAYRKTLLEREQQMELERLRELQEERDDVTKKKDFLVDFYSNLDKNVAFGSGKAERRKQETQAELRIPEKHEGVSADVIDRGHFPDKANSALESSRLKEGHQGTDASNGEELTWNNSSSLSESSRQKGGNQGETSSHSNTGVNHPDVKPISEAEKPNPDHHKRSRDAVAAAKERFLARKKAKEE